MAQSARDAKLDNRTTRLRLDTGRRYFREIGDGLTLVYRRTTKGYGTWSVKIALPAGKYAIRALGTADDYQDADGATVLSFYEAQAKARERDTEAKERGGVLIRDMTVKEASESYLTWFRANRKGIAMTESAINAHILPAFGDKKLADLTTKGIREWQARLVSTPARLRTGKFAKKINQKTAPKTADDKMARKSTANRILTVFKAMLNKVYNDGDITSNATWRNVKPFKNVDQARIRYLTDAEAQRLVNACPADLSALVRAALLTGARRGELAALTARDVNLKTAQIYIAESKSGKPRHVPLNPEGLAHFRDALTGKTGDQLVFTRKDGAAWGHNYHVRALKMACEVAKVKPMVSFHELRHTYASHLANAGVDLLTISKLLGHSDTRITAKHYAHLADKTLAIAVTKLPSFEMNKKDGLRAVA